MPTGLKADEESYWVGDRCDNKAGEKKEEGAEKERGQTVGFERKRERDFHINTEINAVYNP